MMRETCATVMKWATVRTVLVFSLQMKLKTRQRDFDNAFVQAELNEKEQICVTLSVGIHHAIHRSKDVALKLLKHLCGMKEASKLWHQKVTTEFMLMGFERSQHNQWKFMHKKKKTVLLLHTDDCLLFCETDEMLKQMIATMQRMFSLTQQDVGQVVFDYWEIELTFKGTKVTMRQDGLMKMSSKPPSGKM